MPSGRDVTIRVEYSSIFFGWVSACQVASTVMSGPRKKSQARPANVMCVLVGHVGGVDV